jgi:predicted NACHT family NTPase
MQGGRPVAKGRAASTSTAVSALVDALQDLQARAGMPSARSLAQSTGKISHTTIAESLSGKRVPNWPTLSTIVQTLGGDQHHMQNLWRAAVEEVAEVKRQRDTGSDFTKIYRAQLAAYYGKLEVANLQNRIRAQASDLFIPLQVEALPDERSNESGRDSFKFTEILDQSLRSVVLGDPGSGKTTACHFLMWKCATEPEGVVPFYVRLAEYASVEGADLSLIAFVERQLRHFFQIDAPEGYVEESIKAGKALFILDALDELIDDQARVKMADVVELFCAKFPLARVIVTSRVVGYRHAYLDSSLFRSFVILNLSDVQVKNYIQSYFSLYPNISPSRAAATVDLLLTNSNAGLTSLLRNPLTLTISCAAFVNQGALATSRVDLYRQISDLWLARWDMSKGIAEAPVSTYVVESILQSLAFESLIGRQSHLIGERELQEAFARSLSERIDYSPQEASTTAQRLTDYLRGRAGLFTDVGTRSNGEPLYAFTHRPLMEYYAGLYLVRMSRSPVELAQQLIGIIDQTEYWEVVEIAVQVADQTFHGGANEVILLLEEGLGPESEAPYRLLRSLSIRNRSK